jgi:DNA modification methylase
MKKDKLNKLHPTQKPVELAERAISNHKASTVLDLFGGSGSTLIACEKTNRKCFMSELDPHYVDVIVERWMKYTGKMAYLTEDSSGKLNEPVQYADLDSFRGESIKAEPKSIARKNAGRSGARIETSDA